MRNWACRQLGRRLSGVSAQTDSVTADELSAALSGVGTRALLRNASTLTEHANWDLLTTVVRDGNVSLLARLALAYTLLQTSCGDESQADAHRNTLGLLLLQRAAEPGLTEPECELLETVRALPIPSWADEAAMREALILLCPPEGEADQSIWTPMQLPPPPAAGSPFPSLPQQPNGEGEDPVLSADARGVILDRASHRPLQDWSAPAALYDVVADLSGRGVNGRHCLLCAAGEMSAIALSRSPANSGGCEASSSACGPSALAAACTRCFASSLHAISSGAAQRPSVWLGAGSTSLAALRSCDALSTAEAAGSLLTTYLIILADGIFDGSRHDAAHMTTPTRRVDALTPLLKSVVAAHNATRGNGSEAFRMPRCDAPAVPGAPTEDWRGRLARRQWESRPHAVLDTLMRAASRNGGLVMQQDVLRALGEIAPTAPGAVQSLADFVRVLVRRQLRPARAQSMGGAQTAATAAVAVANDEHTAFVASACDALPREERACVLASCLMPLTAPARESSAHFAQALPLLDVQFGRLRALMNCDGLDAVAILTHTLAIPTPGGAPSATAQERADLPSSRPIDTALDFAAWLHLRARPASEVFSYVAWLSECLRNDETADRNDTSSCLLAALRERVKTGWELPAVARLQCLAAARAAASRTVLASGCSMLLADAIGAGIELPSELRSLQAAADSPPPSLPTPPLQPPAEAVRMLELDGKGDGLEHLLTLQRHGDMALRRGLESLLRSDGGSAHWHDFVHHRLARQMHTLVVNASTSDVSTDALQVSPVEPIPATCNSLAARRVRRQLALLLSRLVRWSLPARDRLRALLEPVPDALRGGRRSAGGSVTPAPKPPSALELEAATRTYLHGGDSAVAGATTEGAAATGDVGGTGGIGGGLLPNVSALATVLLRRASSDEATTTREGAASVLRQYHEWWPSSALQAECRRLIHSSDWGGAAAATEAAVRAIQLLRTLPCAPERWLPLAPSPIDWSSIFDASFAERVQLLPAASMAALQSPPVQDTLVECVLTDLPSLFECTTLRQRLYWIFARPSPSTEGDKRKARWLQLARGSGDDAPDWQPNALSETSGRGLALSDWIRWELESVDATTTITSLDQYYRAYLAGSRSHASAEELAQVAEDVFVGVADHLTRRALPAALDVDGTVAATKVVPPSAAGAGEAAEAKQLHMQLDGTVAARARLLRVCAELGESALATAARERDHRATGTECWLLRALLRLSVVAEQADGAHEQELTPAGSTTALAVRACLADGLWRDLVPQLACPTRAVEEWHAAEELQIRTLCSHLLRAAPALLAEVLLALARVDHSQRRSAGPATTSRVPELLRRAVDADAGLAARMGACYQDGPLSERARALPFLQPTLDGLLSVYAADGRPCPPSLPLTSAEADASIAAAPSTITADRKRKAALMDDAEDDDVIILVADYQPKPPRALLDGLDLTAPPS